MSSWRREETILPPVVIFLLFTAVCIVVGYLNGRNAWKGLHTGAVYARSHLYKREESPVFFWIAFSLSIIVVIMCTAGVAVGAWALIQFS
jgi:hypothetical protein